MVKSKKKEHTQKQKIQKNQRDSVLKFQKEDFTYSVTEVKKVGNEYVFSCSSKDGIHNYSYKLKKDAVKQRAEKIKEFEKRKKDALESLPKNLEKRDDKLNVLQRQEEILSMIVAGFTVYETINTIASKFHVITSIVNTEYYRIINDLEKVDQEQLKVIIATHCERYDFLYKRFGELNQDRYAIKALFNSEKLNGFHSDDILIQINNFNKKNEVVFDINKIKQEDLLFLKSVIKNVSTVK